MNRRFSFLAAVGLAGLNVISVVHDTPTDNPAETDKVQHRATLSFVVARRGE